MSLKEEIEVKRKELINSVYSYKDFNQEVLQKSRELDELLNDYILLLSSKNCCRKNENYSYIDQFK